MKRVGKFEDSICDLIRSVSAASKICRALAQKVGEDYPDIGNLLFIVERELCLPMQTLRNVKNVAVYVDEDAYFAGESE